MNYAILFEFGVRPFVSHWYHRAKNRVLGINWKSFGSTDTYSRTLIREPSDGEAIGLE